MFLIGGILFMGCGSKKSDNPLVGEWKIVEAEGSMADLNKGVIYTFNDDGSMTIKGMGITTKAKYTQEGEKLKIVFEVGNMTFEAKIEIKDKTMKYELLNSDQKFVMEKQ